MDNNVPPTDDEGKGKPPETVTRRFNDVAIGQRFDGYLNATAMCKAAKKEWSNYWQNQQTQEFVAELEANLGIPRNELVVSRRGNGGGTWIHPQVGYHLAQWGSPAFAVQVTEWIHDIRTKGFATLAGNRSGSSLAAPARVAPVFKDYFSICRLIGMDRNQAALGASRATRKLTGLDPLEMVGAQQLEAPQQAPHITATQIGLKVGAHTGTKAMSAQTANKALEKHGFQVKDPNTDGGWNCTDKGRPHAVWVDTARKHSDGAPVRQLRWSETVVDALIVAMSEPPAEDADGADQQH